MIYPKKGLFYLLYGSKKTRKRPQHRLTLFSCLSVGHEAQLLWVQWTILALSVIMDIHPRVRMPGLMELRLRILCNVQAHFLLTHIPLGWQDPNETPAFPRWQWAMLLHSVRAGERGNPSLFSGLSWKNRRPNRLSITSLMHTYTQLHPSHPRGTPAHPQGNFDMSNYGGFREWQVYSRSQHPHRREADWQSSGNTTQVEAVCWTKWAACLSVCLSFLPSRHFRQALCLSLDVYTSLRLPISSLLCPEQSCIGLRWKKRQSLVKRERKKAALWKRQQNRALQFMSRGAV